MYKLIVIPVFVVFISSCAGQTGPCKTPSGGGGTCMSLYSCQPLLTVINKQNRTPQDLELLKKSQCGFEGNIPAVCCPSSSEIPKPTNAECLTPEGKGGKCIGLYSCPHLANLLQPPVPSENIKYVQQSKCQGKEQYSVCCGPPGDIQKNKDQNVAPGSCASRVSAFPPDPKTECCGVDSTVGNKILGYGTTRTRIIFSSTTEYQRVSSIPLAESFTPHKHAGNVHLPLFVYAARLDRLVYVYAVSGHVPRACSDATDSPSGGTATTVDQYPWLVNIEYEKAGSSQAKLLCGGALISGKYVLTAGHCVKGPVLDIGSPKRIRLGDYDTQHPGKDCVLVEAGGQDCTDGEVKIDVERSIPHPQYDPSSPLKRHDIALIRMRDMAPYTDFIRPICLPNVDRTLTPPPQFTLYAAGWGAVSTRQSSSNLKLHVDLPFITQENCQLAYKAPGRSVALWKGQLCAGGEKGKDSCKGDSGGPLMYENMRTYEATGVVSFGPIPCGLENIPGVYTNVFEYLDWIRSTITG